jgi:ribonuclease HII
MSLLKAFLKKGRVEVGCDEAGRGCLAGPVVAAAVILPSKASHPLLNDSKQMSEKQRLEVRTWIMENALAWAVAYVGPEEIDEINILNASIAAMHRALDQLTVQPDHILVDGNRFHTYKDWEHTCVIKGDSLYRSIAAASVLAKTFRDDTMEELHQQFQYYGWKKNKGYPTKEHRAAIAAFGSCAHHRKSFALLPRQLTLSFEA